ncbi:MobP2 family relaxase [Bacillus sp. JJ722]|uniref:MobP2 family relaxase n=1 Tax=Bacillus sp. JJ722 TaxID=3122973 RepID=UPI002FFFA127
MSNENVVPGVVLKTRFIISTRREFSNYIEYIDREEAKQKGELHSEMYALYQDYMGNPDKTSSLFTENQDRLQEEDKKKLKGIFKEAQQNKSIMWQDVISFNNAWLEEHGLYDSKTHSVDERKLMDATRLAMKEMTKKEGLEKTAIWSAAIHYNTDNIHIHVATVEKTPTRERGKRKPRTLDAMKSKAVNHLMDRSELQKQINDLIRKNMVDEKKKDSTFKWRNREFKPLFLSIYNRLPEDRRQWKYSYNTLQPVRADIDQLTKRYIEKYHKDDYEKFLSHLDKEVQSLKKAYGEGDKEKGRYEDYKKNKIEDLYKRMGNAFLKEMREYDQQQRKLQYGKKYSNSKKYNSFVRGTSMQYTLKKMERALKSEYESWKNLRYYEQLQREIEYERR